MSFVIPEYKSNLMVLGVKLDEPIVEPSPSPDYPWYTDDNGGPGEDIWGDIPYEERLYFDMNVDGEYVGLSYEFKSIVEVDWGDGSKDLAQFHLYSSSGNYRIKAKVQQIYKWIQVFVPDTCTITSINELILPDVVDNLDATFQYQIVRNINYFNTSGINSMVNTFNNCHFSSFPVIDTSNILNLASSFYQTNINVFPNLDVRRVTDFSQMFYGCSNLTKVEFSNTESAYLMNDMFAGCTSLKSAPNFIMDTVQNAVEMFLDSGVVYVPEYNMHNVTAVSNMMANCHDLVTFLPINFNNCNDFDGMFENCDSLTNLGNINIKKGASCNNMFYYCKSLDIDKEFISYFFSNSGSMYSIFKGTSIKQIPNLSIDYASVKEVNASDAFSETLIEELTDFKLTAPGPIYIANMFMGCNKLKKVVNFEIDCNYSVDATGLFSNCENLTYLSIKCPDNFETGGGLIFGCTNLTDVYIDNGQQTERFYCPNVTYESLEFFIEHNMFFGDRNHIIIINVAWDSTKIGQFQSICDTKYGDGEVYVEKI